MVHSGTDRRLRRLRHAAVGRDGPAQLVGRRTDEWGLAIVGSVVGGEDVAALAFVLAVARGQECKRAADDDDNGCQDLLANAHGHGPLLSTVNCEL